MNLPFDAGYDICIYSIIVCMCIIYIYTDGFQKLESLCRVVEYARINIQHGPRLLADASGGPFLEGPRSGGDLIHYPFFVGMFH